MTVGLRSAPAEREKGARVNGRRLQPSPRGVSPAPRSPPPSAGRAAVPALWACKVGCRSSAHGTSALPAQKPKDGAERRSGGSRSIRCMNNSKTGAAGTHVRVLPDLRWELGCHSSYCHPERVHVELLDGLPGLLVLEREPSTMLSDHTTDALQICAHVVEHRLVEPLHAVYLVRVPSRCRAFP